MLGENLTVFERRFDDWTVIHPRRWVATTDRGDAARFISEQTKEIRRAQLEAADRIIVSQDRIASAIDDVGVAVERVADGLEGLEAAFEWGFSEIVWHLEQERVVLKDILKVLQAPLDTQAKELRQRAEEAYRSGWIDDALEDFLESEKRNRYDFTVHHSLGSIYLFHKKALEKALEYFEKAAKYATLKSPYHASLALLHVGLIKYLQEDFQGAYEAAKKATELSPDSSEVHYECARYCACLGKHDEAIDLLGRAIGGDRNYCLKAQSEKDFDSMQQHLHAFFSDLLTKAQNQAHSEIAKSQETITYAESLGLSVDKNEKFAEAKRTQNKAEQFFSGASLFDYWDAVHKASYVPKITLRCLENYISGQISRVNEDHANATKDLGHRILHFFGTGRIARCESELAKLRSTLSEIQNRRTLQPNPWSEHGPIERMVFEHVSEWVDVDEAEISRETPFISDSFQVRIFLIKLGLSAVLYKDKRTGDVRITTVGGLIDYLVNAANRQKQGNPPSERLERPRAGTQESGLEDDEDEDEEEDG